MWKIHFNFGHIKFEIPLSHLSEDTKKAAESSGQELRSKFCTGDKKICESVIYR